MELKGVAVSGPEAAPTTPPAQYPLARWYSLGPRVYELVRAGGSALCGRHSPSLPVRALCAPVSSGRMLASPVRRHL